MALFTPYILSAERKIPKARDSALFTALSLALTTTTQHMVGDQNFRTDEYIHTYIKVEMNFFSDDYPDTILMSGNEALVVLTQFKIFKEAVYLIFSGAM